MLSGIGPKQHLTDMDIPTVVDLPVGLNLQDHPVVQFNSLIRNNTYLADFPQLTIQQIYQLIATNSGPLAYSPTLYTYYNTKSNPNHDWPNIVLSQRITLFSTNMSEIISIYSPQRAKEWAKFYRPYLGAPYLSSEVFLRRPRSFGSVRLSSKNPFASPLIDPNLYQSEQDFEDMVEAIKFQLFFLQNTLISKNL